MGFEDQSKSGSGSAFDASKKHKWNDLGRRSDEFELHLDINDAEFVDTVKAEYRSSSPSWADCKKFKYPGGEEEDINRRQEMLRQEKKILDAEKKAIERKRASDERRRGNQEESKKRTRSG